MAQTPIVKPDPYSSVKLFIGDADVKNTVGDNQWSHLVEHIIFSAMLNKGYRVEIKLRNDYFELITSLNKSGYFFDARRKPLVVKFKLSWSDKFKDSETTEERTAIVSRIEDGHPTGVTTSHQTLLAVDPASYYLGIGDAHGGVWKGKVEKVVEKVVGRYAPFLKFKMSETTSKESSQYWQMRMTPKEFIISLLEWAVPLAKKKTKWIITSEDYNLAIKEQATIDVKEVKAKYQKMDTTATVDTVRGWTVSQNLYLAQTATNILNFTPSASYGEYVEKNTSDENTGGKSKPEGYPEFTFYKPDDEIKKRNKPDKNDIKGMVQVIAEPEFYNSGDYVDYSEYAAGRSRSLYYATLDSIMNATIEVPGHSIWSSPVGLGTDVIVLMLYQDDGEFHYMSGKWIVNGFKHQWKLGAWHTWLNITRMDGDANAKTSTDSSTPLPLNTPSNPSGYPIT